MAIVLVALYFLFLEKKNFFDIKRTIGINGLSLKIPLNYVHLVIGPLRRNSHYHNTVHYTYQFLLTSKFFQCVESIFTSLIFGSISILLIQQKYNHFLFIYLLIHLSNLYLFIISHMPDIVLGARDTVRNVTDIDSTLRNLQKFWEKVI